MLEHDVKEKIAKWRETARPNQLLPDRNDWYIWLVMAGRGFGKTWAGAQAVREWAETGAAKQIGIIGATEHDVKSVMIEGMSGILSVYKHKEGPIYEPSKKRLVWPNGAKAFFYSGDRPNQLRGPQFDAVWIDELCKFQKIDELWEQIIFTLRIGENPRMIITTTPKSSQAFRKIVNSKEIVISTGSTLDNNSIGDSTKLRILEKYENTGTGAREIYGELSDDAEGALWTSQLVENSRVDHCPELKRVVVAIDPAVSTGEQSSETGIVVAGLGYDGIAYVLEDVSCKGTPNTWIEAAIDAYDRHQADRIIAEINMGGNLVEQVLKTRNRHASLKTVRASRGKATRAEPVVALYEQGRVKHVENKKRDNLLLLEEQMTNFVPGISKKSPDRMDALVWAITELMLSRSVALAAIRQL